MGFVRRPVAFSMRRCCLWKFKYTLMLLNPNPYDLETFENMNGDGEREGGDTDDAVILGTSWEIKISRHQDLLKGL